MARVVYASGISQKLAVRMGISKSEARSIYCNLEKIIQEEVSAGNRVVLRGFGSFYRSYLKGRAGIYKGRYVPRFASGDSFRRQVKG